MDDKQFQKYVKALNEKASKPCPRCDQKSFQIAGESAISLSGNPNVINTGAPYLPTVIVVCSHCGYIFMHSQLILDETVGENDD